MRVETSRGYEVELDNDGEINLNYEDTDCWFNIYLTKKDVLMMLNMFRGAVEREKPEQYLEPGMTDIKIEDGVDISPQESSSNGPEAGTAEPGQ